MISLCSPLPHRDSWYPVFIDRDGLLSIWDQDALARDVQAWEGEPKKSWFRYCDSSCLTIAYAYVSNGSISFENGRHRTRWLLQQGYQNIPISMTSRSIVNAIELGIFNRRAFEGECIM